MSAEMIAILAVGVSQTLLMVTLAGFLLANQRRLDDRLTELAKSHAALDTDLRAQLAKLDTDLRERIAQLDADLRERIARLEGLIEGLRDTMTAQRADRPDAA